jgi:hypothetical protein
MTCFVNASSGGGVDNCVYYIERMDTIQFWDICLSRVEGGNFGKMYKWSVRKASNVMTPLEIIHVVNYNTTGTEVLNEHLHKFGKKLDRAGWKKLNEDTNLPDNRIGAIYDKFNMRTWNLSGGTFSCCDQGWKKCKVVKLLNPRVKTQ